MWVRREAGGGWEGGLTVRRAKNIYINKKCRVSVRCWPILTPGAQDNLPFYESSNRREFAFFYVSCNRRESAVLLIV